MSALRWQSNQSGGGPGAWSMERMDGQYGLEETVPKNVFVLYCIYVGTPIIEDTEDGSTPNR
jgi:hypothetical protein